MPYRLQKLDIDLSCSWVDTGVGLAMYGCTSSSHCNTSFSNSFYSSCNQIGEGICKQNVTSLLVCLDSNFLDRCSTNFPFTLSLYFFNPTKNSTTFMSSYSIHKNCLSVPSSFSLFNNSKKPLSTTTSTTTRESSSV
jgi:hypothetical protein